MQYYFISGYLASILLEKSNKTHDLATLHRKVCSETPMQISMIKKIYLSF